MPLEGKAPWWTGGQFSLDATRYARHVGGLRGGIQLWDAATGRQLGWLDDKEEKDEGGMKGEMIAFSGDRKRMAAVIFNGLRVWDVASQATIRTLENDTTTIFNYWHSLALSADGSRLAAFSLGIHNEWVPFLKVFDVATGREEYVLRPPELGTSLPDAPLQNKHKVWLAWMDGPLVPDAPLQFALDGTRLLMLLAKTDLAIWKLEPGGRRTLGVLFKAESAGWVAAALSPDGRRVAACDVAGTLRLWNADDGQPILTVRGERGGGFRQLRFSPDGRWLAACAGE